LGQAPHNGSQISSGSCLQSRFYALIEIVKGQSAIGKVTVQFLHYLLSVTIGRK